MFAKWLQVEATTKCNAWCPGCSRNNGGFGLAERLIIQDLDVTIFENTLKKLKGLEVIDFCGTFGDAIAAKNIFELTAIAKRYANKIMVRTNGSLRTEQWWQEYADLLADHLHEVWFCLDGLADTHSIYRQATDFDTIIANATAFINRKGTAVWQFIPWAHNEHQIKDCIRLSQRLGFKRFEFLRDVRKDFTAKDYRTGKTFELKQWSKDSVMNRYEQPKTHVPVQNCRHLSQPSVYLNANGKISPCCFFNLDLSVDHVEELPDMKIKLENPPRVCLYFCGK